MRSLSLLLLFLATSIFHSARADLVTQSGTWGTTDCPAVVCSEPGDSWSYSFLTNSIVILDGITWDSPITDFRILPKRATCTGPRRTLY